MVKQFTFIVFKTRIAMLEQKLTFMVNRDQPVYPGLNHSKFLKGSSLRIHTKGSCRNRDDVFKLHCGLPESAIFIGINVGIGNH